MISTLIAAIICSIAILITASMVVLVIGQIVGKREE